MEDVKVAAVVMQSALGKKEENLDRMESFVRRAADQGVQIICFPEMNISGYGLRQNMATIAESIPGPITEAVLKMARENGLLILAGLAERGAEGKIFISHFAASPEGLLGVYRKLHLGPPEEGIYRPGQAWPIFQYQRCAFGIELCFDAHFPELSTMLALKGAEIIFIPHASPRESSEEKKERWLRYLTARAYDNSVFIVACNQTGETESGLAFTGTALVLNPRGELIAANGGGEEGIITADLKEIVLRKVRENPQGFFLNRRRPSLYKELAV
jgi:N-carbamoylputrescine amidase